MSLPGGCAIGTRPVDLHIKGLERLGAKISCARAISRRREQYVLVKKKKKIQLPIAKAFGLVEILRAPAGEILGTACATEATEVRFLA